MPTATGWIDKRAMNDACEASKAIDVSDRIKGSQMWCQDALAAAEKCGNVVDVVKQLQVKCISQLIRRSLRDADMRRVLAVATYARLLEHVRQAYAQFDDALKGGGD